MTAAQPTQTKQPSRSAQNRSKAIALGVGLLVAAVLLGFFALGVGAVPTPPAELWAAVTGAQTEAAELTRKLLELRYPRILVALVGGAMFAVSGSILQAIVRNPLASPDIVGVGAGAGLAVTLLLFFIPNVPSWLMPFGASIGAFAAFGLVVLLSRDGPRLPPVRLALLGVAVGAACGAAQQLALLRGPDGIGSALTFLAGTVYGADLPRFWRVLPWAAVLLPTSWVLSRQLDLLNLGDDTATALGQRVTFTRYITLTVAVALAAAAVTACGILGFVGLVAPHLSRLLVGPKHSLNLPVSALLGGLLVLAADTLGRTILPPLEIPAGLVTTLLGAPYFLYLLNRSMR